MKGNLVWIQCPYEEDLQISNKWGQKVYPELRAKTKKRRNIELEENLLDSRGMYDIANAGKQWIGTQKLRKFELLGSVSRAVSIEKSTSARTGFWACEHLESWEQNRKRNFGVAWHHQQTPEVCIAVKKRRYLKSSRLLGREANPFSCPFAFKPMKRTFQEGSPEKVSKKQRTETTVVAGTFIDCRSHVTIGEALDDGDRLIKGKILGKQTCNPTVVASSSG
ncbi:OLC1v1024915C1 [Oldenlandia corymbosa var. corymbosa]|uniref:OLC1v1024915C1 n=1 Tax=Oldenlandia corymbosa var. corymbosa TaxID=529605 RepID=A0AAV1C3H3_OLDCO|nr:OLC1v1024915C1 [Oldenlandia corymbosa var. corymbosa]